MSVSWRNPGVSRRRIVGGLALALVLSSAGLMLLAARGDRPPTTANVHSYETDAQAIFASVMSPYCPGLLLANCPSPAADELRNAIRSELRAGRRVADVEARLYSTFGDRIRATPPTRGVGLVVWTFPVLAFAATGAWLILAVRRTTPHGADDDATPAAQSADDAEALRQLDDELDIL